MNFAVIYNDVTGIPVAHMTTTNDSYSPIMSEHDNSYYRVLMEQVGTSYTIHTGDKMMRILEEFALPKEIRVKLAMIKAYDPQGDKATMAREYASTAMHSYTVWSNMDMYNNTYPSEFSDIGWRCNTGSPREFYCVITNAETLDSLRGEPL